MVEILVICLKSLKEIYGFKIGKDKKVYYVDSLINIF